jgi:peptidoglycan/LPS O-acetylase OafA/YrhL
VTYAPSEQEKRATAVIQGLAALFLFVPPMVGLRLRDFRRSPYMHYWGRVSLVWSLMITILMVFGAVASYILEIQGPIVALGVVHVVFCITGAMSSYFNTPFRYWFVADRFCRNELGNVYGQLMSTPGKDGD